MQKSKIKLKTAIAVLLCLASLLTVMSYTIESNMNNAVAVGNIEGNAPSTAQAVNQKNNKIDNEVLKSLKLIPGGMPFGMSIKTDGLIVCATSDIDTDKGNVSPSRNAGIKSGDIITAIDETKLEDCDMLYDFVVNSDGAPVILTVIRDGKSESITVNPAFSQSEKEWRLGLWIKDSTRGIGTVTFINAENSTFAGLGHSVSDADSKIILPLKNGISYSADITGIKQGVPGVPGELHGTLKKENGVLYGNTAVGVYGKLNEFSSTEKALFVAEKSEIHKGKAKILCTLCGNTPKEYGIEIKSVTQSDNGYRDMTIEITDGELLALTGGIVQGMSGSPIIQDGKLIGAVTHVLIDNPKLGYGIYAENMLSQMKEIYSAI